MSARAVEPKIVRGIEWYVVGDEEDCECARCGSSAAHRDCPNCGGEGYSHHDCGEDCCMCLYPEDNVVCDWCRGRCGSWHCISSPAWCEANPRPGREHIESTALRHWDD